MKIKTRFAALLAASTLMIFSCSPTEENVAEEVATQGSFNIALLDGVNALKDQLSNVKFPAYAAISLPSPIVPAVEEVPAQVESLAAPDAAPSDSTPEETPTDRDESGPTGSHSGPVGPAGSDVPTLKDGPLIGGFFIYTSSSSEASTEMFEGIKATGADTVVTFGTRLKPSGVVNGRPSAEGYENCTLNGVGCIDATMDARAIHRVFTYADKGQWGAESRKCSNDTRITNGKETFTVFFIPTDNNGCSGSSYDAIVTKDANADNDANTFMMNEANRLGLNVFAGMPAPVMDTKSSWLPDLSYIDTLSKFTERFVTNYEAIYAPMGPLAGYYHHLEMPLKNTAHWDPTRHVYGVQNAAVAKLSNRSTLVSPYIDARRDKDHTALDQIPDATRKLFATSSGVNMIVMPQDGQGTGKVGAFDSTQKNNPVDAPSAGIVGNGTYDEKYVGSTGDFMRKVVEGAEGREVWLNVELMAATEQGAEVCPGASNARAKADIGRIREQVRIGYVPGVSKTLGFMWTPYATCGERPLRLDLAN